VSTEGASGRPGRSPAASRHEVLAAAQRRYRRSERIDVVALSAELGLGRVTIYRWFGSREGLIAEVLAAEAVEVFATAGRTATGSGAARLLSAFDHVNRTFAGSPALRSFLQAEQDLARRLVLSSESPVRQTILRMLEELIEEEVAAGRFVPAMDVPTLAYAVERLAVAFLYNDYHDALVDIRGDVDRLRIVEAALLGLTPAGTS
jgi:AcrR family transcriptional regulator